MTSNAKKKKKKIESPETQKDEVIVFQTNKQVVNEDLYKISY